MVRLLVSRNVAYGGLLFSLLLYFLSFISIWCMRLTSFCLLYLFIWLFFFRFVKLDLLQLFFLVNRVTYAYWSLYYKGANLMLQNIKFSKLCYSEIHHSTTNRFWRVSVNQRRIFLLRIGDAFINAYYCKP